MSFFFKRRLRRALFGFGVARPGCHRGAGMTPEQAAERRDWIVNRAAGKLSLNAEQKPLLAALIEQIDAQRQAMVGSIADPRAEMRSWFAGASFDAERAQSLINDKASALQNQSPAVVAALAAFYDSLNPAQQQKVRDFMDGGRHGWFRSC
jgi:Spy/CpxP family protein refolding chaperone